MDNLATSSPSAQPGSSQPALPEAEAEVHFLASGSFHSLPGVFPHPPEECGLKKTSPWGGRRKGGSEWGTHVNP